MTSALTTGFQHVATITRDLDRLSGFYAAVFDVDFQELPGDRGRHGLLRLTETSAQHVFEVPEDYTGPFPQNEMMRRGRIDHLAIAAADEEALAEIRRRAMALDACNGIITNFGGALLSIHITDPDGLELEAACFADGAVFGPDDFELRAD